MTPDPELTREQTHLEQARAELARMRARTLELQAQGGDAIAGEQLALTLHRRAQTLTDDPGTALFFGRLDTDGSAVGDDGAPQRWYVGRRHVSDAGGEPLVVDWRADVATAFYRATTREPRGVVRRRRFGVAGGRLTAYEDEVLAGAPGEEAREHPGGADSRIVQQEVERPRAGPMRDIVATIQPEQDVIVRTGPATTVCVQGAPGTGKTAVGLHRAAWLLYAHRDRLSRTGVLVVGPSATFLEHVSAVLPALGEVEVRHTTAEELLTAPPAGTEDPVAVATLKGDARMAEVLRRAVRARVRPPTEALVVPRGSRRWRVPASRVRDILDELATRGVRHEAARAMLPQRLAHAVLLQMEASGDSPDDRVQDAVARSAPVRRYADGLWPALDAAEVLHRLLTDPQALAEAADGLLEPDEQELLLRADLPRSHRRARWSPADRVLLDELGDLLERTPSLGHVVLDEAQDLSAMQLRAVGRRASTGSLTVLGDIAQGTTPWAVDSWDTALEHLGKPGAHLEVLTRGFRVPGRVLDLASRLLPLAAPGLQPPVSIRRSPGELDLRRTDDVDAASAEAVRAALGREGTVGVVGTGPALATLAGTLRRAGVPHVVAGQEGAAPGGDETAPPEAVPRLRLVPAALAKGLEFDHVVVVDPAGIAAAEPDERTGLRRLYVVLTRAVTTLTVVHRGDLPEPLTG